MEENKGLLKSAMSYGLLLGIFWVIKYVFFMLGISIPFLQIIYWVLTPLTLVLALLFTSMYKYQLGGKISFFQAWQYGILLYFFAGLIVSLLHYVFYRYIAPPDLLSSSMDQMMEIMKGMNLNSQMQESIEQMPTPTPIQMAIQGIFTNVFYGIILSIPVAALLCRNNFTGLINQNNKKGDNL